MTLTQSTDTAAPRPEPFRWSHEHIARACDRFREPQPPPSQRQFAQQQGIPRATLGAWLRRPDPQGLPPELVAFLRSPVGLPFLRRLVLALFVVFLFQGACGLRLLGLFLRLTQLDRFVASSHGALHDLAQSLQADLGVFADEERARLAQSMTPTDIALVADENFHAGTPCLVAIEPVSNFLVVEAYQERRDAATWTTTLTQALDGLPVTVVVLTSDQAKGLIACAHTGLEVPHLAEIFHGQRDLCRPLAGSLQRQKVAAEKEFQLAEDRLRDWQQEQAKAQAELRPGRKTDYSWRIDISAAAVECCRQDVQSCETRQQQVREAVRGLADDYHPFDSQTGAPVAAESMKDRLEQRLGVLEQVTQEAGLPGTAQEALAKGRRWLVTLVAAIGWFWSVARRKVEALDLPEEARQVVYEQLLPGWYWQGAARRGRTAAERKQQEKLAEELLQQARAPGGVLARLTPAERCAVERVSRGVVRLFARSSACVEGRNGRLSLCQHGQTRLSAGRLKALTAVHNYLTERADGTTAAERFFGHKPRDVFAWLLERMADLPRPAAKRPKKAPQTASIAE
jgi:hypothetical protein